jgi:hypothetical protein
MACWAMEIERLERPNAPFSFVSARQGAVAERLTLSRGELVRVVRQQLDEIVRQLLVCPTAEIFKNERKKVFGEYSLLMKSVSKVILTDTDPMVHQSLVQDTLRHYESLVTAQAQDLFGADVTGEILFSIATLRRTYRLVGQILAKDCPEDLVDQDRDNGKEFSACVSWCVIHLDCITTVLANPDTVRLPLDVLQEVLCGLRYSVSAYAHARMGYDLRYPKRAPDLFGQTEWDDEDRYLAAVSTEEMKSAVKG